MPDNERALTYHLLRYTPNLLRDEFANIGVVLRDASDSRLEIRMIESDAEFARLRRIHPAADLELVRGLEGALQAHMTAAAGDADAWLARMEQALSGTVQLSPRRAVLSNDFDGELDRLYRDHVEPMRSTVAADSVHSRAGIRARVNDVFRRTGILNRMVRNLRVEKFTHPGDPMRLDYAYRRNGTRGFVQALALDRDPAQVKALAFTSGRVREKTASVEFTAVSEAKPKEDNLRHRFVSELLAKEGIQLVPLPALDSWARDLGATLR